jgi:CRISP-associated protein Cas1
MVSGGNRHATHLVNAMLNYAYAVLESQVRIATVSSEGLDATIGYLHACRPGRMALVYDLMEPLRPRVDQSVLDSCGRIASLRPTSYLGLTESVDCTHS